MGIRFQICLIEKGAFWVQVKIPVPLADLLANRSRNRSDFWMFWMLKSVEGTSISLYLLKSKEIVKGWPHKRAMKGKKKNLQVIIRSSGFNGLKYLAFNVFIWWVKLHCHGLLTSCTFLLVEFFSIHLHTYIYIKKI